MTKDNMSEKQHQYKKRKNNTKTRRTTATILHQHKKNNSTINSYNNSNDNKTTRAICLCVNWLQGIKESNNTTYRSNRQRLPGKIHTANHKKGVVNRDTSASQARTHRQTHIPMHTSILIRIKSNPRRQS